MWPFSPCFQGVRSCTLGLGAGIRARRIAPGRATRYRIAALLAQQGNADAMVEPELPAARPLSPHLQVYRWPLTMTMSILHRVTGGALYVGTLLLAWWLVAAATGPAALSTVQWVLGTPIGLLVLFGYSWALMHHMFGGIRHFVWDLGYGFRDTERNWLAAATLVASVAATFLLWVIGYWVLGGVY
jgi:succinate dehydrogenase / fumarate reductase, cytochrome b subunit